MAPFAPWLNPPDYLSAMRSGAATGLQARAQDEASSGAADRLRLAYDQIAAQERRAHEALMMHGEQQKAALALRAQQAESINLFRQGELRARAESEQRQRENMERLSGQFQSREDRLAHQFATREKLNQEREDRIAAGKLGPVKSALLGADVAELRGLERKLATTEPTAGVLHTGLFSNKAALKALSDRVAELRKKIQTEYSTPGTSTGTTPAGEAVTTKAQYDALPSGTVYTGKDGKQYRKP